MNTEDDNKYAIPLNDDEYKELDTIADFTIALEEREESMRTFYHILRQYYKFKGIEFNSPLDKSTLDKHFDESVIRDILKNNKEFHKFAYDRYGIQIHYDKEKEQFSINT